MSTRRRKMSEIGRLHRLQHVTLELVLSERSWTTAAGHSLAYSVSNVGHQLEPASNNFPRIIKVLHSRHGRVLTVASDEFIWNTSADQEM
jgi:hypothetical protein